MLQLLLPMMMVRMWSSSNSSKADHHVHDLKEVVLGLSIAVVTHCGTVLFDLCLKIVDLTFEHQIPHNPLILWFKLSNCVWCQSDLFF